MTVASRKRSESILNIGSFFCSLFNQCRHGTDESKDQREFTAVRILNFGHPSNGNWTDARINLCERLEIDASATEMHHEDLFPCCLTFTALIFKRDMSVRGFEPWRFS
jgi:hypothetical protein